MQLRTAFMAVIAAAAIVTPAAALDDEAEKMRLAEELVEIAQVEQLADQIVQQMMPAQMEIAKSVMPGNDALTDAQRDAIFDETVAIMQEEMGPSLSGLISSMTPLYAEVYTLGELEGIVAFYKSPTGQAMLAKQSVLMEKSIAASTAWAQQELPGIMARAAPRIEAAVMEVMQQYAPQDEDQDKDI